MRNRTNRLAVLALGLLAASPSLALQDVTPDMSREDRRQALLDRVRQEQDPASSLGPVVNTTFLGGTLAEYIEAVRRAAGDAAPTIMVRGDSQAVPIAPVDLRDIRMFNALQLLDGQHNPDQGSYYRVSTDNVGRDRPAYLVAIDNQGRPRGETPHDFRVLPIREITEALPGDPPEIVLPAETVLTAIETVLEITDAEQAATEPRYHPESGLLMLSGPSKSLDAADAVLQRIFGDVENRRDRARDLQRAQGLTNPDVLEQQLADAKADAEIAEVRFVQSQRELEVAHQYIEEQRGKMEAGVISEPEFNTSQIGIWDRETQVREQQIKLERTVQRVQHLQTQLERSYKVVAGGGEGGEEVRALREENAMLRDRLAALEARVTELNNQLKGRGDRAR